MQKLKILLSTLVLLLMCGCMASEKPNKSGETISIEPSVITINSEQGDYKLATTEDDIDEADEQIEDDETEDLVEEFIYDDLNKIYTKETKNPDEVVMRFVGDICFYDDFSLMGSFRDSGSDINNCIDASLLNYMRDADIFMVNNEFCYSDRGAPTAGKKYAFRSKPSNVSILSDMGVDIVSLANNHAYDWGPDALSDSFDILKDAKVPFVGAGNNIEEAMKPVYFKANGITISFVSATQIERLGNPDTKEATETTPGVLRTLDPTKACKVIEEAKANSDFCVMYVHWGSENTDLVEASQRDLAKKYVESGVDLIIGDHSHCLQGIDYIGDVPVFYSMSNYWFNSKTVDTGISEIVIDSRELLDRKKELEKESEESSNVVIWPGGEDDNDTKEVNLSAKIKSVKFIPAIQRGCKTKEVDESDYTRILTYLQGISDYAEIDLTTGEVKKSDTNHNTQGGMNTSPTKKSEEELAADAKAIEGQISGEVTEYYNEEER